MTSERHRLTSPLDLYLCTINYTHTRMYAQRATVKYIELRMRNDDREARFSSPLCTKNRCGIMVSPQPHHFQQQNTVII